MRRGLRRRRVGRSAALDLPPTSSPGLIRRGWRRRGDSALARLRRDGSDRLRLAALLTRRTLRTRLDSGCGRRRRLPLGRL
ncbi:MAG TPA: hypothetical protein VIZ69_00785, partial [Thermoanaerobaculia bacterium]